MSWSSSASARRRARSSAALSRGMQQRLGSPAVLIPPATAPARRAGQRSRSPGAHRDDGQFLQELQADGEDESSSPPTSFRAADLCNRCCIIERARAHLTAARSGARASMQLSRRSPPRLLARAGRQPRVATARDLARRPDRKPPGVEKSATTASSRARPTPTLTPATSPRPSSRPCVAPVGTP